MPNPNSENPGKGRFFQERSVEILAEYWGVGFQRDHAIPIGKPAKDHRFDLVSSDLNFVGECKNYSWTEGANVPSAKMGFINEAVFYLSFLASSKQRFVVMRRDVHPKRLESLADYYFRTYRHLLNGVFLIEIDLETGTVREIGY